MSSGKNSTSDGTSCIPQFPRCGAKSRFGFEAAALLRSPVCDGDGVAAGDGRPVLLIPGFMAGDGSLGTMTQLAARERLPHPPRGHPRQRRLLRGGVRRGSRRGWSAWRRPPASGSRSSARAAAACSRRALAVRRPGSRVRASSRSARRPRASSPCTRSCSPRSASWARWAPARVPGMFSLSCLRGDVLRATSATAIAGPFPADVPYVALYSQQRRDRRLARLPRPGADEQVEVAASHCGMGVNAQVYLAVAKALHRFRGEDPLLADDCRARPKTRARSLRPSRRRGTRSPGRGRPRGGPGRALGAPWRSRARSGGARWRAPGAGSAGSASRSSRRRRGWSRRRPQKSVRSRGVEERDVAGRVAGRRVRPRASRRGRRAPACGSGASWCRGSRRAASRPRARRAPASCPSASSRASRVAITPRRPGARRRARRASRRGRGARG